MTEQSARKMIEEMVRDGTPPPQTPEEHQKELAAFQQAIQSPEMHLAVSALDGLCKYLPPYLQLVLASSITTVMGDNVSKFEGTEWMDECRRATPIVDQLMNICEKEGQIFRAGLVLAVVNQMILSLARVFYATESIMEEKTQELLEKLRQSVHEKKENNPAAPSAGNIE